MEGWQGTLLDLKDTIILVPTTESARRLREALAVAAAEKGGAVMAPYIWSPEAVLGWQIGPGSTATRLQEQLVWATVLELCNTEDHPALFPSAPAMEKKVWAAGVAETLASLKLSVGAGGLSFADVAQQLAEGMDGPRWADLALLEKRYLEMLAALGVQDVQEAKQASAQKPALPPEIRRVLVFALADPPRLVCQWLLNVARQYRVGVKVFVHAPDVERARFDELGIPLAKPWTQAAPLLDHDLPLDHLHLVGQPEEQAVRAVMLLRTLAGQGHATAVGVCEAGLSPHLVGVLTGEGVRAYDPAGREASQHPLLEVLRTWQQLVQTRTWKRLASFLRLDDVLSVLSHPAGFKQAELLKTLDEVMAERLPATLDTALTLSHEPTKDGSNNDRMEKLHLLLAGLSSRMDEWEKSSAPGALRSLLDWIYGKREFHTEAEHDRGYVHLLGESMRLVEEAHRTAQKLGAEVKTSDILHVALGKLETVDLADPRGDVDLVLRGWLELHWEPAPGLVICGFNDESVPGTVTVDAFLPDHVREQLGLSCQASRCARDAYLLTAMAAQRRASKSLHLVLGQTSDDGDVLRPSRLLFSSADESLPERVRHLFPKETSSLAQQEPARKLAWTLRPWREHKPLTSVSPSLLASYLRCPLRCYFARFLKMSSVDSAQREMSPLDFGSLVHEALAAFGREDSVRDSFAQKSIAEFLESRLDALAYAKWGARPLLSTVLQIETARQRLHHAARVQVQLREEGWRIVDVERDLNSVGELALAGLPFRARADRLDVNTRDGTLRLWDYKTRAKVKSPEEAHFATAGVESLEDPALAWKCFQDPKGKVKQWTDLQLPLYAWALQNAFPAELRERIETMGVKLPEQPRIETAYFHLPAALMETCADPWQGLDETLIQHAHTCAVTAVTRIQEGIFWPPAEDLSGDEFEELFMGDAASAVSLPEDWRMNLKPEDDEDDNLAHQ